MKTSMRPTEFRLAMEESQSAWYGDKSQLPEDGAAAAANDCEWRRVA